MANFKSDESFLEKISIGAIGTKKVFEDLTSQGHHPIELERGSMSYKIWKKIKIKRIRVPDILLVNSGVRIESRAKTKLEITMSHSYSDQDRGWDYGLKDNDYVAIVVCEKSGEEPIDWSAKNVVQYISISDLKETYGKGEIIEEVPKGAQEGFEKRITWCTAIAKHDGQITEIANDKIKYKRASDNRTISLSLTKRSKTMLPRVSVGENISANQIIASVVPITKIIPQYKVESTYYLTNLNSNSLSERYASAKALAFFDENIVKQSLLRKLEDDSEHIYVKLEAAASLARFNIDEGFEFISSSLKSDYNQNVLEAVIILGEIRTEKSCELLISVLNNSELDSEIRAGAAWSLGEINSNSSIDALSCCFNSINENIKIEAARALAKLTNNYTNDILSRFDNSTSEEKPGIAWALSKSNQINLSNLLTHLNSLESRQWISYIIGYQREEEYVTEIENLKNSDPEMYFAITLLWKIIRSWIYNLKEY